MPLNSKFILKQNKKKTNEVKKYTTKIINNVVTV